MNIFGEGFPDEIISQVKLRQTKYGSGFNDTRSPEDILYLNARTAWCKLVSSAFISDPDSLNNSNIKELGYRGNTLAKNYVLFNGTTPHNSEGKSGLNNMDFSDRTYAYTNWGIQNADFGFRPMAGITSATIKHKNRGSIRVATVNIKANDKISFEIIDVLYLRLGFSILLEWGNSMYFRNDGVLETNPNNSLAEEFLDGSLNYLEFLGKIKEQRKKSHGNYDAMFGKVTNFHWSFMPDGTYNITLDLVSVGDVVESFKIAGNALNVNNSANSKDTPNVTLEDNNIRKVLKTYAASSDIADYLYKCSLLLNGHKETYNFLYNISNSTNFDYNNYWKNEFPKKGIKDICFIDNKETRETFYYIRLGNLLKFIEEALIYKVKAQKQTTSVPLLSFDYSIDDNFMHAPPQLMSFDPSICMVRRTLSFPKPHTFIGSNLIDDTEFFNFSGVSKFTAYEASSKFKDPFMAGELHAANSDFAEPFMVDNLPEVGNVMNIYVNFRFILSKLQELVNTETNELKLFSFLKEILNGINSSFGGYSKLDIFLDETTNQVKIIDQNPLPSTASALRQINSTKLIKVPDRYAFFDLYGYKDGKAGFISDFKFNTELTPEFATMIAVSATSNGNVVGENNTALSKLNLGIEDRFKTEVNGGGKEFISESDQQKKLQSDYDIASEEFYNYAYENFVKYLKHLYYGNYIPGEIQDNKSSYTTYLKLYKKVKYTETQLNNFLAANKDKSKIATKFQPGTGFIPFNLSITMDGLSGMKIGSKFIIDGSYLPSNYPDTVDFLIKNLSHEIKDNKWTVTIESYCIAQGDDETHVPAPLPKTTPQPVTQPTAPSSGRNSCSIKDIPKGIKKISQQQVYDYFKTKGYSKAACAGIISSLQNESSLNLNAFNPEGGGCGDYGLAQWRGDRQTGLHTYSKTISQPIDSVAAQLGFVNYELVSSIGPKIKGLTNPEEASYIMSSEFERFKGASDRKNKEVIQRQKEARTIYNKLA